MDAEERWRHYRTEWEGACDREDAARAANKELEKERALDIANLHRFQDTIIKYTHRFNELVDLVNVQADDEELWRTSTDCYQAEHLQVELRRLHALIENPT